MPHPPATAAATNARRTTSGSMARRLAIPEQTPPSSARSLSRRRRPCGGGGGGAGARTPPRRSGVTVTPSMFSPRRARTGEAEREQERAADREHHRPEGGEVQLDHVEEVQQQQDAEAGDDQSAHQRADVDRPAPHAGRHASGPPAMRPWRNSSLWRTSTAPSETSASRSSVGTPAGGVRTLGQSTSKPPLSRSSTWA